MSKKADRSKWVNNIARIVKKKNGGYMLKFERKQDRDGNYKGDSPFPLTINEGDILHAELTKESLAKAVEKGLMTEETAEKISKFEKFTISLAPSKEASKDEEDEKPVKKNPKKAPKRIEEEDEDSSDDFDDSDESDGDDDSW